MKNGEIILVKTYGGEMFIGTFNEAESDRDTWSIDNPRMIAIIPTMTGDMRVAIGSVCEPFHIERLKKNIKLIANNLLFTVYENELEKDFVAAYKSEVSGIKLASASDVVSIQNNAKPGEFIL